MQSADARNLLYLFSSCHGLSTSHMLYSSPTTSNIVFYQSCHFAYKSVRAQQRIVQTFYWSFSLVKSIFVWQLQPGSRSINNVVEYCNELCPLCHRYSKPVKLQQLFSQNFERQITKFYPLESKNCHVTFMNNQTLSDPP